jgi:hypothetical protein
MITFLNILPKNVNEKILATLLKNIDEKILATLLKNVDEKKYWQTSEKC